MRPVSQSPAPFGQRTLIDDAVVEALTRIGTSPGDHPATREEEHLRDNCRRLVNKCFPTLVKLLRANGRARDFAALLAEALDPLPIAVPLAEALIAETEQESAANVLQAKVLAGDRSGPTLGALAHHVRQHKRSLDVADAVLTQHLVAPLTYTTRTA